MRVVSVLFSSHYQERIFAFLNSKNFLQHFFWARKDLFAQHTYYIKTTTSRYVKIKDIYRYVLVLSRNERCLPTHFGKIMTKSLQAQRNRMGGCVLDSSGSGYEPVLALWARFKTSVFHRTRRNGRLGAWVGTVKKSSTPRNESHSVKRLLSPLACPSMQCFIQWTQNKTD